LHRLHYTEWGDRRNPNVVVCAHGYSGNARDFDFLARALAAEARVVCIDFPGRGESDWLATPLEYHFGQFLADAQALLAHLGARRVQWIGTSMGGLLGMLLAARPMSPVKRLVMNDVGAFVPLDALQAIAHNIEAPACFASLEEVEAHMRASHRDWGELTGEQWRHLARHGARRGGGGWRLHYDPRITRLLRPLAPGLGLFFWDAWYCVACPALLLRGERSAVFPADVARAMLAVKPAARLVQFSGCGHAPSLMADVQIEAVRNFVREGKDKSTWREPRSSSFPASSWTPTPSSPRSRGSGSRPPAPSPI
jgi:pimeloyl-ACP methyl ester carboxylesterase